MAMASNVFGTAYAANTNTGDWYVQYPGVMNTVASQWDAQQLANNTLLTTTTATFPWAAMPQGIGIGTPSVDGSKTLEVIKDAIHVIKDETVSEETKVIIETKVEKYRRAGFERQAKILEDEIKARVRLARIKEWDYKVLPYKAIKQYDHSIHAGYYHNVHIDPVAKYLGVPEGAVLDGEFDKIVPEHVIDSLLTAKDRQVFDEFNVLWVEKVKDPLLLGKIKELPDYFLIDEWGDDIRFSDILKASKQSKQAKK